MKNSKNDKHKIHVLKMQLGHRSPRTTLSYARNLLSEHLGENLERFTITKKTEKLPEERS